MSKKEKNEARKKQVNQPVKKTNYRLWSILVFFSAFFLYANTLKHQFALDDDIYTKKNIYVQEGFSAIKAIFLKGSLVGFNGVNDSNYRPLVLFDFMIETKLFGMNPSVYHFFNIFFFGLTCVLLFRLLRMLFKNYHFAVPLACTLLFVFHPIHTEVVANIKSRDEILSLLFGLLSFIYLIKYVDEINVRHLVTSVVLYFLASLCKENSLTFAFVGLLMLYFFRGFTIKKVIVTSIPFLVVAGLYMLIRSNVLDNVTFKEKMIVMNNSLMAATNASEMYATNFVMLGKHLYMLFVPHPLSWDYSYNQIPVVGWTHWKALSSLLIYLAMGCFIIYGLIKRNVFAFCMLFFLITLFLSSNLVIKIGASFGERFLYAPSIGFCIAIPLLLVTTFKIDPLSFAGKRKSLFIQIIGVVIALYAMKTFHRNKVWENNFTLFQSGIETSPNSARTHYSFASENRVRGESNTNPVDRGKYFTTAIDEYQKGIAIYPDQEAYYNLGVTYYSMNELDKAKEAYEKSYEFNKKYAPTLNNLGVIYFMRNDYNTAEKYFKAVLEVDSSYADAKANIGAILHNRGDYENALVYYEKALKQNPNNVNVMNNLVKLYNSIGDKEKASYYENKSKSIQK